MNSTSDGAVCPIEVPGFINRGNCRLLCRPALWTDIFIFFFGNYAAHAATILARPGQSLLTTISSTVTALLLPGSGIWTGMEAVLSGAKFAETDLRMAARAGALCTVVREQDLESVSEVQGNKIPSDIQQDLGAAH